MSDLDEMYLGPIDLLEHFEAGAVVTHQDALQDDSDWSHLAVSAVDVMIGRWPD